MKKLLTAFLLILTITQLHAQETVINRNVLKDKLEVTEGPSLYQYFHFGTNVELETDSALSSKWSSGSIGIGNSVKLIGTKPDLRSDNSASHPRHYPSQ